MALSPAAALDTWHRFVAERDTELLDVLLAPDVVFRAPTYWSERRGKPAVTVILSTVMTVFQDFRYHRQWIDGDEWALEFSARIGDLDLRGVDLIHLEKGQIESLEVLIRPPNAVAALRDEMERRLTPFLKD